jgi:tRNA nucleotidyltransferase/poly(A) polymerase
MIKLTEKEEAIANILQAVAEKNGTVVRIAGGFVRDRLLGLGSDDIDITTDNISGKAFAELVLQYMRDNGLSTPKEVTTVEANVEANKNLESAILPIFGVEVDFAQLRKETYSDDSRNPQIEVNVSAEDDAKRRDLTINGLFYNIHTKEVEDYVNGIEHLNAKWATTPVDPLHTYLEDPLRILRAVRFAARFKLNVDPFLWDAAKDPRVQEALHKKISRERVWTELVKIMGGPHLKIAMLYLDQSGLRDVFLTPKDELLNKAKIESKGTKWTGGFDGWDKDQNNPYHDLNVWDHTTKALHWYEFNGVNADLLIGSLALLLHDVGKCDICSQQVHPEHGYSTYHEHEISSAHAANQILLSLKASNDTRERVVKLVRNHMRLHTMPKNSKAGLRRVLRDVGSADWTNLVEMSKADSMGKASQELDPKYDEFDLYIQEFMAKLDGGSEVKPPLDGHKIMNLLGIGPGKEVGLAMKALKEALIESPEMTEEEAEVFVKDYWKASGNNNFNI